jgi:threonine dehydratase
VARALRPGLPVYAVQAKGAAAIHDAWHLGRPVSLPAADTFADGLATRNTYPLTFGALREGLAGFVTVTDADIAEAVRILLSTTHSLVEGAGAAGLAGSSSCAPRSPERRSASSSPAPTSTARRCGGVLNPRDLRSRLEADRRSATGGPLRAHRS